MADVLFEIGRLGIGHNFNFFPQNQPMLIDSLITGQENDNIFVYIILVFGTYKESKVSKLISV